MKADITYEEALWEYLIKKLSILDDNNKTARDIHNWIMVQNGKYPILCEVEELLDKAREEGRREQQKLDCELYGTAVATDEEVEEMWKTKLERMRDKAEKELDKLSNK